MMRKASIKKRQYAIKVITIALLSLSFVGILSAQNVNGAEGTWNSQWLWDANGGSTVYTTNANTYSVWTLFSIWRASGQLGSKNVNVPAHSYSEYTYWGQPLLDRQGRVYFSGYHAPGFNP